MKFVHFLKCFTEVSYQDSVSADTKDQITLNHIESKNKNLVGTFPFDLDEVFCKYPQVCRLHFTETRGNRC